MPLIKSISGIRGTIGGEPGNSLSPLDIVQFTAAYGTWIKKNSQKNTIIVGRDGRISGELVERIVVSTLQAVGLNVINTGLSTTPTVEMTVKTENAAGGIILTASHNPKEWNALKLLNDKGEFIDAKAGAELLEMIEQNAFEFVDVDKLGTVTEVDNTIEKHIQAIVDYPLVNKKVIAAKDFKIVIDAINSTGAIAVPQLLKALGVKEENIIVLNAEVTGKFAHNPEPLPENLTELCNQVKSLNADLGIAVDPDVDRLCFVCEDGSLFGEEYTLVAVADYILQHRGGNTVSNLSSTKALKDVTIKHGYEYFPSAVGEVNVVTKMKEVEAVIGGEGNGGIIVPDFHYGRDALIGIALFLTYLTEKKSVRLLRNSYPNYVISKNKIEINGNTPLATIFDNIKSKYRNQQINEVDGLKIEFENDWVHLRPSNTEPIIRIYAESEFETTANNIAKKIMQDIKESM